MTIEINITEKCNLDCSYCHEGREKSKKKNSMTKDTALKALQYIRKFIDYKNINEFDINLNGGEPFLEYEIFKYIVENSKKMFVDKDYVISCSTNGTLLNDEIIDFININNISMQISIDGNEKEHNLNRKYINGQGSYNDIINNLNKLLKTADNKKISTSYIITSDTVNNIYNNFLNLIQLGIKDLNLGFCFDSLWTEETLEIANNEFKKVIEKYKELILGNQGHNVKVINGYLKQTCINSPYYTENCGLCEDELAILPSGDILPCGTFITTGYENYIIGNINKDDFDFLYAKKKFAVEKIEYQECLECKMIERCRPVCYANNFRISKDIYKIPYQVCYINQLLVNNCDVLAKELLDNHKDIATKYIKLNN